MGGLRRPARISGCAITSAVIVASIAACGNVTRYGSAAAASAGASASQAPAAEPGMTTFICQGTTSAQLLQWQDSNGSLSGTYESSSISGQAPDEQVTSASGDLSGTLSGNAISLSIGLQQLLYGTLNASQLTLNVPQPDGSFQAATCNSGSLSDWNGAVAALDSKAASDNNTALQQQAQASSAAADQQQENNAQADVSTLTQDANLSSDVSSIANDVQATDTDLTTTRSDAANGNGDQCLNASTTVYNDAATTIYNDVLTTTYNDVGTVASDITRARTDISTVQHDQAALRESGLPATPGATTATSAAQAAIASAISTVNTDIDHVNGDLDTAYQIADSVGTGACAGDGPGTPPAGLTHLK